MTRFNYNVNLQGLRVLKTNEEQQKLFFYKGHPEFLIPDFGPNVEDIWTSFLNYLENVHGDIYDQDGGEITSHSVVDESSGLTQCEYVANGIQIDENSDIVDMSVKVEGYVVEANGNTHFLTTRVTF